ncbi:hypothetical protein PS934_05075 [Pseudomonas fluorescens]|uniref:hypothetical protein n=1 Tax=Pseudomonas fluorescens TaxID=294 RepID=UPI00123EEB23|nr:hypothetical protein [Pseudomonas fluorescens]VVQ20961.1 hypothetical protein PS934_05075 [Pseudomonas fluorescens]
MSDVKRYRAIGEMVQRSRVGGGAWVSTEEHDRITAERDALQLRLNAADQRNDDLETLLEQVLTNANRSLPSELHRSIRKLLPAPACSAPANEAEREPFESWHRTRFATKNGTGQPTRDMHNGAYDPNYGPPGQQHMWEAWQARAALSASAEFATVFGFPVVVDPTLAPDEMRVAAKMIGIERMPPMEYDEP